MAAIVKAGPPFFQGLIGCRLSATEKRDQCGWWRLPPPPVDPFRVKALDEEKRAKRQQKGIKSTGMEHPFETIIPPAAHDSSFPRPAESPKSNREGPARRAQTEHTLTDTVRQGQTYHLPGRRTTLKNDARRPPSGAAPNHSGRSIAQTGAPLLLSRSLCPRNWSIPCEEKHTPGSQQEEGLPGAL